MEDKVNSAPLYLQLVNTLEKEILENLSPHDKLSSERELTNLYNVSRITVRLALQELEKKGLVYKKHGKGTFVSEVSPNSTMDLSSAYSFTDQMRNLGKIPKTIILSFKKIAITSKIAQELNLSMEDEVFELERLRLADGITMMLERSYVPVNFFPDLSEELIRTKPLYEAFAEDYKQQIRLAEEEFYASIALTYDAGLLGIQEGAPVLHIIRKTYNNKNHIIEYTFSIARADLFRYKIRHTKAD